MYRDFDIPTYANVIVPLKSQAINMRTVRTEKSYLFCSKHL